MTNRCVLHLRRDAAGETVTLRGSLRELAAGCGRTWNVPSGSMRLRRWAGYARGWVDVDLFAPLRREDGTIGASREEGT